MTPPRLTRRKVLAGGIGVLAAGVAGPAAFRALAHRQGLAAKTRAGTAFGTTVALTFAGADPAALERAFRDGFAEIRACEAAASLLRPDSALSRLNRDGALDRPDAHLVALARFALELAADTDGAFDPTVQPLWPLWSDASAGGLRPSAAALADTVALIDWRAVEVSEHRIAYARPGVAMTLNGILQGYAADRVAAAARRNGIEDAFVDTGEFGAFGAHPDGRPWVLGGRDPERPDAIKTIADPFSGFASTSAGYGTPFSDDARDNHIYDPRTGISPAELSSVTTFAPSGLLADGLSTAVYVLGEERGRELVARRAGCRMIFTRAGEA